MSIVAPFAKNAGLVFGMMRGTVENLVLAGPHVGPDGIRRSIGSRHLRDFIPLDGAQRHSDRFSF